MLLIRLLLWAVAIIGGWLFSDYWRNLLVNAYEARRHRFEALQNIYDDSETSPKLQKQIDDASAVPSED
jgi:hypothetical protein